MNEALLQYAWILWDIIAVALIALFAFVSAERGFIRTLISFGGYIVAAVLADLLAPMLAEALYDGVVKDVIRLVILNRLEDAAGEASSLSSAIPEGLARLMGDGAADLGSVFGEETGALVEELIDAALRDPVLSILGGLCFILVFTVTLLIVRHLSRLFRGMYRVPILGTADTVLGGIAGILEAAVALIVISLAMRVLIGVTGGWDWLNPEIMEETFVWRIFWNTTRIVE